MKKTKHKRNHSSTTKHCVNKLRDVNSKTMFHDPLLCCQFLKDNFKIALFKDIQPEDIEDVSELFQSYMGMEFEADAIKRIYLKNGPEYLRNIPLYIISLIEHKSEVDYNVVMQLLRYIVCIWTRYEKEMNRRHEGISKNKSFRYPPIIPIVYYEGDEHWTADLHLRDRIMMNQLFGEFIPDFTYALVRIHDFSDEELLSRENEMSLLMLINKIQRAEDFHQFLSLPQDKIDLIVKKAPEPTLDIIASTIWSLCMKMNVPEPEAKQYVQKVKERQMGYLFENMEKIDIQEERRITAKVRKELADAQKKLGNTQKELSDAHQALHDTKQALHTTKQEAAQTLINTILSFCQTYGLTEEATMKELMERCNLTSHEAGEHLAKYRQAENNASPKQ